MFSFSYARTNISIPTMFLSQLQNIKLYNHYKQTVHHQHIQVQSQMVHNSYASMNRIHHT